MSPTNPTSPTNRAVLKTTSNFDSYVKMKMPAIGIDIGGTKISGALVAGTKVISEILTVFTPPGRENIVPELVGMITQLRELASVSSVGIATAGIVDSTAGDVLASAANISGWTGTKLKTMLESKVLISVYVDNDCNAAALGDAAALNLLDKTCVVGISIGTGIGGGIILNGKPYRGASFAAGEVGHQRITIENKRLCSCGLYDCWEEYGAGKGLLTTTRELLAGFTAEQTPLAGKENLTTYDIAEAAGNGDIIANKALDIWHQHLAVGLVNIAFILNPDCFIFSGGLSSIVDLEKLEELVKDRCLPELADKLEFVRSPLGETAGIVGAAQLTGLKSN